MKKNVICLGLVVTDILVSPVPSGDPFCHDTIVIDSAQVHIGGDAANQAVALGKLSTPVLLLGKVGDDAFGRQAGQLLRDSGVDISRLIFDPAMETSMSVALISKNAERTLLYRPAENNSFGLDELDLTVLNSASILSVGSLRALPGIDAAGMRRLLSLSREKGVVTVADATSNVSAQSRSELLGLLPYLDFFLPSEVEAADITGMGEPMAAARELVRLGVKAAVVKTGRSGCCVCSEAGAFTVPALPVNAVDTTGAGDNFVAGFISRLYEGASLAECACAAICAGSLSTLGIGAGGAGYTGEDVARESGRLMAQLKEEA